MSCDELKAHTIYCTFFIYKIEYGEFSGAWHGLGIMPETGAVKGRYERIRACVLMSALWQRRV